MLSFDADPNPNGIDLEDYDPDAAAAENLSFMEGIPQREMGPHPEGQDIEVADVIDVDLETAGYPSSSVKLYYPEGEGPFPVLFFIHGGAFYGGWQFLDEPLCRQLCRDCGIVVASPKYVLAPEFQHPLPLIELWKMLLELRARAEELRLDMGHVAIGGGSAGAHHALALCQIARERADIDGLRFAYGLFFYPVLDMFTPQGEVGDEQSDTWTTPRETVDAMNDAYCGDCDRKDPLVSPLLMDLSVLPPCAFFSGRTDLLNAQTREFVARCYAEGRADVLFKQYAGVPHGFCESDVGVEAARDAKALAAVELKRVLFG